MILQYNSTDTQGWPPRLNFDTSSIRWIGDNPEPPGNKYDRWTNPAGIEMIHDGERWRPFWDYLVGD